MFGLITTKWGSRTQKEEEGGGGHLLKVPPVYGARYRRHAQPLESTVYFTTVGCFCAPPTPLPAPSSMETFYIGTFQHA